MLSEHQKRLAAKGSTPKNNKTKPNTPDTQIQISGCADRQDTVTPTTLIPKEDRATDFFTLLGSGQTAPDKKMQLCGGTKKVHKTETDERRHKEGITN